jgi:hypothetical protein
LLGRQEAVDGRGIGAVRAGLVSDLVGADLQPVVDGADPGIERQRHGMRKILDGVGVLSARLLSDVDQGRQHQRGDDQRHHDGAELQKAQWLRRPGHLHVLRSGRAAPLRASLADLPGLTSGNARIARRIEDPMP